MHRNENKMRATVNLIILDPKKTQTRRTVQSENLL